MNRRQKMLTVISFAVITLTIILLLGGWLWLRYNSEYEEFYPTQNLTITGGFVGYRTFEYKGLSASFVDYQEYDSNGIREANPIKKINHDCPLVLHINEKSIIAVDLTPDVIKGLGGEHTPPRNDERVSTWRIFSMPGFNPPYTMTCHFYEEKIIHLSFSIQNPPSQAMEEPKPCPIEFSFGKDKKVRFPIPEKEIKEYLGFPAEVYRHLKWP